MNGSVGILNVGAGDTKLSFDPKNPREMKRAAKIVTDMLKRGYSILIQVGTDTDGEPLFKRAKAFDENTSEYIIADADESAAVLNSEYQDGTDTEAATASSGRGTEGKARRGRPPKLKRVKASETRAVAVSRSAGG